MAGAFGAWGGGQVHVIDHHCIVLRPKQGICIAPLLEAALSLFKCCMSAKHVAHGVLAVVCQLHSVLSSHEYQIACRQYTRY